MNLNDVPKLFEMIMDPTEQVCVETNSYWDWNSKK